jgi:superfamily II DNA/RNA helicase
LVLDEADRLLDLGAASLRPPKQLIQIETVNLQQTKTQSIK